LANDPARTKKELEEQLLLSNSLAEIQEGKQQEKQKKEMKHEEVHKAKALEAKWDPSGRCVLVGVGVCVCGRSSSVCMYTCTHSPSLPLPPSPHPQLPILMF
jgi:hypothetical protein